MIRLDKALHAWGTPDFAAILKQEIEQLGLDQLPLQQGLSSGNYVAAEPFTATIISASDNGGAIRAKAGIFYKGVLSGCSCAGDPTPTSESSEYCEVQLDIDKATSATTVALVMDQAD